MSDLLKKCTKGLLALLPIILVLWLFSYVYGFMGGLFSYVFGVTDNSLIATMFIFSSSLLLLYYIGGLVEREKEFIVLKFTELVINRIPIVKTIYNIIKDIIGMFSSSKDDTYLGVAYINMNGARLLGFITKKEHKRVTVFVPTTPNPTSGFVLIVDEDKLEHTDMSVQDAFKTIISLGTK